MMTSQEAGRFSAASAACEFALPRRKLLCSHKAGWTSLLVQKFESPSHAEAFETRPTPDQLIVVVTGGCREVESFSDGRWRKAVYQPGSVSMTAGDEVSRLRWRPLTPAPVESLHLYIPQHFFSCVQEEYRRAGVPERSRPLDALSFSDPTISRVALSLAEAVQNGAPDFYAQSAAQFLAAHLLSAQTGWPDSSQEKRLSGEDLSDLSSGACLGIHKCSATRSLFPWMHLAREACISRFHFGRLFKERMGVTPLPLPRQNQTGRRRVPAQRDTDLSVLDIALSCGYGSAAHFTAAFHKRFFPDTECVPPQPAWGRIEAHGPHGLSGSRLTEKSPRPSGRGLCVLLRVTFAVYCAV